MYRVVLVRHGESVSNAEGRLQGRADSPLSEAGVHQAHQLGRWLSNCRLDWGHVYASPLSRARRTAEILLQQTGNTSALELCDELLEIDVGNLEGKALSELQAQAPLGASMSELIRSGQFLEFGGEGPQLVLERLSIFKARVQSQMAMGGRVLVVAHGGLLRQFFRLLLLNSADVRVPVRTGNCCLTYVRQTLEGSKRGAELRWHLPVELLPMLSDGSSSP